jgi:hypothetical protein
VSENNNIITIDHRQHSFHVGLAIDHTINVAMFVGHVAHWTEINLANNTNLHDGYAWTFDSIEALSDYFPYFSKKQRETMINNAVKACLIIKGNYNKKKYDRTIWYALSKKAYIYFPHLLKKKYLERLYDTISQKGEMDFPKWRNGFPQNGEPIPTLNTTLLNKEKNNIKKEIQNISSKAQSMLKKNKELRDKIDTLPKEKRNDMTKDNNTYPETYYLQDESATHYKSSLVLDDPLSYFDLTSQQKDTFDKFWELFPRKSGKKKAMLQWFHDGCHLIFDEIMESLSDHLNHDQGWKDGYVPSPFNYIVDKRWEDEPWEGSTNCLNNDDKSWANKDRKSIFE